MSEIRTICIRPGETIKITCEETTTHQVGTSPQVTSQPKDKGALKYKVGLISDVHFDVEDSHASEYAEDLKNACEVFAREGCAFVCSCGDFAQYNDADYPQFNDWYNAYGYAKNRLRLFATLGNHDYLRMFHTRKADDVYSDDGALYNYISMWNNVSVFHNTFTPKDGKYEYDIHFFEYGQPWNGETYTKGRTTKSKLNFWTEQNGDIYVFISIDYGRDTINDPWDTLARGINLLELSDPYVQQMQSYVSDTPYDSSRERNFDYQFYTPEVLVWLKGLIEDNPTKRIFVFNHHFMPNKAGDTLGDYSHLRIWPVPTSMQIKQKYYSGSNTVCGLTFWFLNKLSMKHQNVVWFSGHSHYAWKEQEDMVNRDYMVKQPTGNEVTPLVDDLNTLNGTEYDYRLYTTVGHSTGDCAPHVHLPSLSKPVSSDGQSLYGGSDGGIMEVYENGIVIRCYRFKEQGDRDYRNEIIKDIEI